MLQYNCSSCTRYTHSLNGILIFIGMINPPSSIDHRHILIEIDYYNRWIEVLEYNNCIIQSIIKFLEDQVITRFGMPFYLVCDNGPSFSSTHSLQWVFENKVNFKFSNYYL